jgi:hypothetical protein
MAPGEWKSGVDALLPAACCQGVVSGVLRAEVLDGLAGHRAVFIGGADVVAGGAMAHLQSQALASAGQGQIANGFGTGLCIALIGADANARDMGISWLKDREPHTQTGADTSRGVEGISIGVVKTLVRSWRCEADWFDPRGEPRCSLEDRSCQGMVLTAVSSA